MHDSLINRFRGAFWGIWLGETATACAQSINQPPVWSLQTLAATERWVGIEPRPQRQSAATLLPDWLPIALLYHDQPQQLQQQVQALQAEPIAAVLGQTVSLILRERFVAAELIPQVIRDLDLSLNLPLVEVLLQVQGWVTQPADLAAIGPALRATEPANLTLALSLYSFLSSPEHFQISLLRLGRILQAAPLKSPDPALAGAVLGAVSGAYNGLSGMADGWSMAEPEVWELKLFQSADQLLKYWAGASSDQWLQQPHASLIAAPRTIRRI